MSEDIIEFEFVQTNFYRRWPCTVCGGTTEKVNTLTEARWSCGNTMRVCESCLKAGNIDERLEQYAEAMDARARAVRGLIGQLKVPSYTDWEAQEDRANIAHDAQDETGSGDVYKQVMEDDAAYHEWRQKAKDRLERGGEPRNSSNPEDLDLPF